ncbi:di-heme oxidoredictase family protein [Hydrogenophaga sp.]
MHRTWGVLSGLEMLGSFCWKANVAKLVHQTAGAFHGDIGITSRHFPNETCPLRQEDSLDC